MAFRVSSHLSTASLLQRARSKAGSVMAFSQCSYCYRGNLYSLYSWNIGISSSPSLKSSGEGGRISHPHSGSKEGSTELLSGSKRSLFTVVKLQNLGNFHMIFWLCHWCWLVNQNLTSQRKVWFGSLVRNENQVEVFHIFKINIHTSGSTIDNDHYAEI